MGRLFGTDGIRGVANEQLDCFLALKTGQAAAEVLTEATHHRPLLLIGKDTRISSDMLESALAAGICSVGGDVLLLGTVPTPAVAYLTRKLNADAGIMISASHNTFEHNGIKIFNSEGFKLSDELEDKIENHITTGPTLKTHEHIGRVGQDKTAINLYIDHVAGAIEAKLSGLRILVDCANGSASVTARDIFSRFEAETDIICADPDGININNGCGSTHLDILAERVVSGGYDVGIAFDGDADRCLAVNEKGEPIDGDHIMAICGAYLKSKGQLSHDTIVATVMSNLGFHMYAKENGVKVISAAVGDRYVLEEMQKGGYVLGGEQSGHLIFLNDETTGDGQFTAMKYLEILSISGKKASELDSGIKQYPQILRNVRVHPDVKEKLATDPSVLSVIATADQKLNGAGRILVRPSGTEPLVRVMVEGTDDSLVHEVCDLIIQAIENVK